MVKKLKRKFVLTSMTALALILIVLTGGLNLVNFIRVQRNADDLLRTLADNGGRFPGEGFSDSRINDIRAPLGRGMRRPAVGGGELFGYNRTAETPFETRWFWVLLDDDEDVIYTDTSHIASIDGEEAEELAEELVDRLDDISDDGDFGTAWGFRYLVRESEDDNIIALFLDRSSDYHSARLLFVLSLIISAVVLLFMFILVTLLSSRAVAPTVEAFEKQKRFISDASHELKTPLSVISADVDVMEMTGERSEWTASIRDQIARMSQLIRDMLTLSRMEDEKIRVVFSEVDLSETVRKAAQGFFVVAQAEGKRFETEIEEGIHIQGDKDALTQLVTILSDNALKYSAEGGVIQLKLSGRERAGFRDAMAAAGARLEITNPCERLPEGDLDRLFDRFYRADSSRNRSTGGFGIGLSVARAITESHGGRIRAERDGDRIIRFIAEL